MLSFNIYQYSKVFQCDTSTFILHQLIQPILYIDQLLGAWAMETRLNCFFQRFTTFCLFPVKQDRFTTCFKTWGTGSLLRGVEWGFKVPLMPFLIILDTWVITSSSNLFPTPYYTTRTKTRNKCWKCWKEVFGPAFGWANTRELFKIHNSKWINVRVNQVWAYLPFGQLYSYLYLSYY